MDCIRVALVQYGTMNQSDRPFSNCSACHTMVHFKKVDLVEEHLWSEIFHDSGWELGRPFGSDLSAPQDIESQAAAKLICMSFGAFTLGVFWRGYSGE